MLDDLIGGSRWRPVVAAVAVIVIGTTVFFSVAGGSSPSRLPGPPHVVSAARSNQHTTQTTQPDTFTPLQSPSLTSCSASVSNSAPAQGATAETVTVTSAAGAQVHVEADYRGPTACTPPRLTPRARPASPCRSTTPRPVSPYR